MCCQFRVRSSCQRVVTTSNLRNSYDRHPFHACTFSWTLAEVALGGTHVRQGQVPEDPRPTPAPVHWKKQAPQSKKPKTVSGAQEKNLPPATAHTTPFQYFVPNRTVKGRVTLSRGGERNGANYEVPLNPSAFGFCAQETSPLRFRSQHLFFHTAFFAFSVPTRLRLSTEFPHHLPKRTTTITKQKQKSVSLGARQNASVGGHTIELTEWISGGFARAGSQIANNQEGEDHDNE